MIRRMSLWAVVGVALVASGPRAFATYQDDLDKNITQDGQNRTIESGTVLHTSVADASLGNEGGLVTCGTVPAEKNWHVTSVGYTYAGTTTNVRVAVLGDGVTVDQDSAPTTNEGQSFRTDFWLDAGQAVQLQVAGYTSGNSITCRVFGLEFPDLGT